MAGRYWVTVDTTVTPIFSDIRLALADCAGKVELQERS
tara:strand:+ start:990 stop:1103 length:114 start_codon:yes stop_codon:yes gene_type:complete